MYAHLLFVVVDVYRSLSRGREQAARSNWVGWVEFFTRPNNRRRGKVLGLAKGLDPTYSYYSYHGYRENGGDGRSSPAIALCCWWQICYHRGCDRDRRCSCRTWGRA